MSTRRRARNPRASAIVLGQPASAILYHGRTAHLLPVRSSDHRSRYSPGMRLSVKEMVPGPTGCHIILTRVHGPRQAFTLGQLTVHDARALGHTRLDHLWRHWITNHDQEWLGRHVEAGTDTDQAIAERFDRRWAPKLAWLLRFQVDQASAPRLLSSESGASNHFRRGEDGRWIYVPHHDERESDRGYTSSDSRSLRDAGVALTDDEWATHISPDSRYREAGRVTVQLADRATRGHAERLQDAKAKARAKGYDIRDELRRYDRLTQNGLDDKALRQLELLEARVFPSAA